MEAIERRVDLIPNIFYNYIKCKWTKCSQPKIQIVRMERGQTRWGLQEIHPKHKDSESSRDPEAEAGVSEAAGDDPFPKPEPSNLSLSLSWLQWSHERVV